MATLRKPLISTIIPGNSAWFFGLDGPAFIPVAPQTPKEREILPNSRRWGVSVASQRWWRVQSHSVKANQVIIGFPVLLAVLCGLCAIQFFSRQGRRGCKGKNAVSRSEEIPDKNAKLWHQVSEVIFASLRFITHEEFFAPWPPYCPLATIVSIFDLALVSNPVKLSRT
jgi:hypothetical protein